jgi:two-component system OmpR family response regulator
MADKTRVLIVDDEVDYLTLMKEYIQHWGYEAILAHSGQEALEAIKKQTPDIVILDYLMPGMSGIAVLEQIRKSDHRLEVIMFTAHPDMENIQGAKELGVSFFVPKLSDHSSDIQGSLRAALDMAQKKIKKQKID